MSTDHNFWRERTAEAGSNRGPSAYQPIALPLGQTGSPGQSFRPRNLTSYTNPVATAKRVSSPVAKSIGLAVQEISIRPTAVLFAPGKGLRWVAFVRQRPGWPLHCSAQAVSTGLHPLPKLTPPVEKKGVVVKVCDITWLTVHCEPFSWARERQTDGRTERETADRQRKGGRETNTQTKMEGERLRGRETDTVRQTETKMEGERLRGRETDRDKEGGRETEREGGRQRQTEGRQTDRQTEGGRETERERDGDRPRGRETERECVCGGGGGGERQRQRQTQRGSQTLTNSQQDKNQQ